MSATSSATRQRPHPVLTALAIVVGYVLLAAGLGNLLSGLVSEDRELAQFALGHLIPLPIALVLMLLYVRWTGNGAQVWRERPTPTLTPRRWYLIAIPVIVVAVSAAGLTDVPWAEVTFGLIALVTVGTLLVGFGEELAIRGILLTALRERHGELVTLAVTSFVFALAHMPGSIVAGHSPAYFALQLFGLTVAGASYYWVRRVTGRLWVAAVVHAFSDWVLYLAATKTPAASMPQDHATTESSFLGYFEILLWVFLAISAISVIREDRRTRREKAAA
jgi:membrane protease YdiL (CAAX protease family)